VLVEPDVLQHRECLAVDLRLDPKITHITGGVITRQPFDRTETKLGNYRPYSRQDLRRREGCGRLGVAEDFFKPRQISIETRRIGRDGDYAGIKTTEESRDVFESWRI
jgi:hypothetical protein